MVFCVGCEAVSFNHFGLSPEVVRGTQAMGFVEPTPIQLRAFPIIVAGKETKKGYLPILPRVEKIPSEQKK